MSGCQWVGLSRWRSTASIRITMACIQQSAWISYTAATARSREIRNGNTMPSITSRWCVLVAHPHITAPKECNTDRAVVSVYLLLCLSVLLLLCYNEWTSHQADNDTLHSSPEMAALITHWYPEYPPDHFQNLTNSFAHILPIPQFFRSFVQRWPNKLELRAVCPYILHQSVHKKFFRFWSHLVCG